MILLLFVIIMLIAQIFMPIIAQQLSLSILLIVTTIAIGQLVRQHLIAYRQGQLTREKVAHSLLFDLLGLLLTMSAAVWLGGLAGQYAAQRVRTGFTAIIASLLAALVVGFIAAWLVQRTWGMLAKRLTTS
ncbi:MAG: hypothetical protein GXP40_04830 [Chloroflexi bacterium]|nr:hypothetical protein [Chloroflexota bacterium]